MFRHNAEIKQLKERTVKKITLYDLTENTNIIFNSLVMDFVTFHTYDELSPVMS